jgi:hypothetical protein
MKILVAVTLFLSTMCAQSLPPVTSRTRGIIRQWIEQREKNPKLDIASLIDASIFIDDLTVDLHTALGQAERARSTRAFNRQIGESAAGGGATALVSRTGAPDLFSVAMESGALARDREGTVTTLRFGAYGVSRLFQPGRACPIMDSSCDGSQERFLRGLTGSLSLDNSKPDTPVALSTQPALSPVLGLLGQGGRIASAGFRYEVLRRHVPTTAAEIDEWKKAVALKGQAGDLATALDKVATKLDPKTAKPVTDLQKAVREEFNAGGEDLEGRLLRRYQRILKDLRDSLGSSADEGLKDYRSTLSAYDEAMAAALGNIVFKPALTVEYNHLKQTNQAAVSNFRLILDKTFLGSLRAGDRVETAQAALTFNLAFTVYERVPSGLTTGRWRDVQTGLQFDRQLGPQRWENRPTLSLTGYYQYMKENAVLEFDQRPQTPIVPIPLPQPAAEVLNTKGGIGILQAKVEIPVGTSGITLPLAISWSNRTELIKESAVRGQFGISFNIDKLFEKD